MKFILAATGRGQERTDNRGAPTRVTNLGVVAWHFTRLEESCCELVSSSEDIPWEE